MSATADRVFAFPDIKRRSFATALLVLSDAVALEIAMFLGCLTRIAFNPWLPITIGTPQFAGVALGVLILPLAYYCMGVYPGYAMNPVQLLRSRVLATLFVFSVLLAWNYTFEHREWSRGVILSTMIFALIVPPLVQSLFRKLLMRSGVGAAPVLVLGAGKTGRLVISKLQNNSDLGLLPVAVLDNDSRKWGSKIGEVPVAGPLSLADNFKGQVKLVIVAMPKMNRRRLLELVHQLSFPSVIVIPDLTGVQTLWTTSRDLGGVLGLELRKSLLLAKNRIIKRTLDYCLSIPLFVCSLPLLAIIVIWIKIASPGPAFFCQPREGANGKRITIWKLRTMYPDAELLLRDHLAANPTQKAIWFRHFKLKKDPRVLPGIGAFLRASSLDELPQLWNVLVGEMSLVGPRPFPYYHLDGFSEAFRRLRRSVTPGLTGLWQVSDRSNADITVQEAQDTYYIRNWSTWLDIYILIRTVQAVIIPRGAC
ncbi:MAG: exopolysaccharide biosynthesis polyprenyl glycosylphosphotransferase [Bryobacteraceae bacterium]